MSWALRRIRFSCCYTYSHTSDSTVLTLNYQEILVPSETIRYLAWGIGPTYVVSDDTSYQQIRKKLSWKKMKTWQKDWLLLKVTFHVELILWCKDCCKKKYFCLLRINLSRINSFYSNRRMKKTKSYYSLRLAVICPFRSTTGMLWHLQVWKIANREFGDHCVVSDIASDLLREKLTVQTSS